MNFKSVLCAATMLAAAGVAQAFPDYTIYPKPGETLDSGELLQYVAIQNLGNGTIELMDAAYATLENLEEGDEIEADLSLVGMPQYGMPFEVKAPFDPSEILVNGTWVLTIAEGSFTVDGEANPEITASWTLSDPTLGLGEFPQITLESISPADGSKLPMWGGDDFEVKIKTSDDDAVNYIEWTLYDTTDGSDKYKVQGNDNRYDFNRYEHHDDIWTDGLFIAVNSRTKLILGHTYRLDLRFCGIGYDDATNQYPNPQQIQMSTELVTSVYYEGLVPAQEYAKAEYESIDPDPETYDIDDPNLAFFNVTYTAPAKPVEFNYSLGGGAGTAPAGTWTPFEGMEVDENGLCTVWTFTFDSSVIANRTGTISTNIQSMDADGLYVRGNAEDMDFDDINYNIVWNCNCGAPDLVSVDPVNNSTVESLSSITISNEAKDGRTLVMACSWTTSEKMRIITRQGEEIRVLDNPEDLVFSDDQYQVTWNFAPITENGNYIVIIPKYFFAIGEEFDGASSNLTTFEYIVDNGEAGAVSYDLLPTEVDPADGSNVESIGDVTLTFGEVTFCPLEGSYPKIQLYVMNGPDAQLLQERDITDMTEVGSNDFFNPTVYIIHFDEVTADGEYQVVIPEGLFYNEAYDFSMGEEGSVNPEIVLTYTIGSQQTPSDITYDLLPSLITPASHSKVDEISNVYLEFDAATFMTFHGDEWMPKETYLYRLNSGEKELVESAYPMDDMGHVDDNGEKDYDFFNPRYYVINFSPIAEDGQYVIEIAEGTFCDEDYDASWFEYGRLNPAFEIYYTIGAGSGVDAIVAGEAVINVYDLNGVQILKNADVEAAKELKSGLYIINGKKVMIRR